MQISGVNFVNPMSGETSRAEKDNQDDDNAHLMMVLVSYVTGQQEANVTELLACCCDLHLALKVSGHLQKDLFKGK